jgi:putative transposase
MIRKGQLQDIDGRDMRAQAIFITKLFQLPPGLAAAAAIHGHRQSLQWNLVADGADDRGRLMSVAAYHDSVIEAVRKLAGQQGFQVCQHRWVVERTFGWMTRWRRLARDYERRRDVSEAMIHLGMGALFLRRLAHP